MKTLLLAEWIAPISRPVLRGGAIAFDAGGILAVGDACAIRLAHPDAQAVELGNVLVLPGLVNAHTHLELSEIPRPPLPPGGFVGWLKLMMRQVSLGSDELRTAVTRAVSSGVDQCLRFGTTRVGDISRQHALTRPALRQTPLSAISFGEIQAMAQRRGLLEERLAGAIDATHAGPRLRIGLSPHAPYSVESQGYRRCVEEAALRNLPIATHLAENPEEASFLAEHRGSFRELWEILGGWDNQVPRFAGGPIRLAQAVGLLDLPSLLAHVNYCNDEEMALLASGRSSIVYCPRTHAYFGHPPHRWRDMLRHGINVAVGTDGQASAGDLNLVDELRLIHARHPDVAPSILWELVTIRAARALGCEQAAGTLDPGKVADLVAFPTEGPDPLASILEDRVFPTHLWVAGRPLPRHVAV